MRLASHNLLHFAWVLRRSLWLIVLGMVVCTGVTFAISKRIPPVYQASAMILVNGTGASDSSSVFSNQALAQTYSLVISSTDVLGKAAQNLHGESIAQLRAAITASPQAGSAVINIQAQANVASQSANIANGIAQAFLQYQLNKSTAQLQNAIDQLSQNMAAAKTDLDTAMARLTLLQDTHAATNLIAQQNNIVTGEQNYYTALQTKYQANLNLLQTQKTQAANSLILVQEAIPPSASISPKVTLNVIIAAAMSLLLMIVLVLILDWADSTIKTPDDVSSLTGLEALGSVPFDKNPLLLTYPDSASSVENEGVQQAFIAISTNFDVLNRGGRVIQVTSLHAGAGTSTTSVNLAISFASTGMRVLLIDANLRHPSLHEVFHFSNEVGLVNRLNDVHAFHAQRPELVGSWLNLWPTAIRNLYLLPAGPVPPHATSILRAPEIQQLMQYLLRQGQSGYGNPMSVGVDIIILDTSPLSEGAGAMAVAAISDCTVLVVEARKERGETLERAQYTLQRLGSPVIGVVVNRAKGNDRPYHYIGHVHRNEEREYMGGAVPAVAKTFLSTKYRDRSDVSQAISSQHPTTLSILQSPSSASGSGLLDMSLSPRPFTAGLQGIFAAKPPSGQFLPYRDANLHDSEQLPQKNGMYHISG